MLGRMADAGEASIIENDIDLKEGQIAKAKTPFTH
jgi:hypothetical protein